MAKRMTTLEFVRKAMLVHGNKYDYSLVEYVNTKTLVKIICREHGIFEQIPANHLQGNGCPICSKNVLLTTEQFISKASAVHSDKYDYRLVVYKGNKCKVKIICPMHGVFKQRPDAHLLGQDCPKCGIQKRVDNRDEKAIYEHIKASVRKRYGVDNPMFIKAVREKQKSRVSSSEVNAKRIATKRANNSFNTSLCEHRLYEKLKDLFGDENVKQNYVSDVYPYKCDFYIVSRDMYIELNAHWSHGHHWFDSESDNVLVTQWLSKGKYYENAAETFSVRDVKKRQCAAKHKLNYIVFWQQNWQDANDWIAAGCPDGCDWKNIYSWKYINK